MASLTAQSYQNLDIVLVDDGSTDSTAEMLDGYAHKDGRIHAIHQQNGGISRARLTGFQLVRGGYLVSVDPDDWLESDHIERLVKTAVDADADFVYCDYDMVYADLAKPVIYPLNPLTPETYLKAQLAHDMWGTYWNKLFRTSLLRDHNIAPIPGITVWDDYVVVNACAAYSKKIAYCPHVLYHYNQTNANSVTKQRTRRSLEEPIIVLQHLEHHFKASGILPHIEKEYQWQCLRSKRWMLDSEFRDFNAWRNTWPELNSLELSYSQGLKQKLVKHVISHHDRFALLLYWAMKVQNRINGFLKIDKQ